MRHLGIVSLSVGLVVLLIIYFLLDPSDIPIFPKCLFLSVTGYKCAGCGMQRAIHSLLHFHIRDALRYNALFVISIPVIMAVIFAGSFRMRFPKLYAFLTSMRFAYSIIATILTWWLLRNMLGC